MHIVSSLSAATVIYSYFKHRKQNEASLQLNAIRRLQKYMEKKESGNN